MMNQCQLSISSVDNIHMILRPTFELAVRDNIHTVLHPTFELAVRDNIIRNNPADGVMAEIKRWAGKNRSSRYALTLE